MVRVITLFVSLTTSILLLSPHVFAQGTEMSGKRLFQSCIACHGELGQGNDLMQVPAIAGLTAPYLSRQIKHFQNQTRGAANDPYVLQMQLSSQLLSTEQDIQVLTEYLANLAIPALNIDIKGDVKRGQNLYNGNCGACHGSQGEGNNKLNAPRLAHQSMAYLVRQVKAFQLGSRGGQPDDKLGRQMAMMAKTIDAERDIPDILSYLQSKNKAQ